MEVVINMCMICKGLEKGKFSPEEAMEN